MSILSGSPILTIGKFKYVLQDTDGRKRGKELLNVKPPESLIEGALTVGSLALISGQPHSGKSFLAVDLGLCVATGTPWNGHQVKQGGVEYLAAEGFSGLKARVSAWLISHNLSDDAFENFAASAKPMDLRNPEAVDSYIENLKYAHGSTPIRLVILDTLARCFGDGTENSSKHMGEIIGSCAKLQDQLGATVLLIHHTDKAGKGPRGSSALLGAVDHAFRMTRDEASSNVVTLSCDKSKDSAEPAPMALETKVIDLTSRGIESTSLVLTPSAEQAQLADKRNAVLLNILASLTTGTEAPYPDGLPPAKWATEAEIKGIGRTSFYGFIKSLEASGKIRGLGTPHQKNRRYRLAETQSEPAIAEAVVAPPPLQYASTQPLTAEPDELANS